MDLKYTFFSDVLGGYFLSGNNILCVDIHFSSIEKILRAMCSVGDMTVFFGYEIDFFSSRCFRILFKSCLEMISTLCY